MCHYTGNCKLKRVEKGRPHSENVQGVLIGLCYWDQGLDPFDSDCPDRMSTCSWVTKCCWKNGVELSVDRKDLGILCEQKSRALGKIRTVWVCDSNQRVRTVSQYRAKFRSDLQYRRAWRKWNHLQIIKVQNNDHYKALSVCMHLSLKLRYFKLRQNSIRGCLRNHGVFLADT